MTDMFWGDRYGVVVDPTGLPWSVATHKEDLTPEQMQEGMKAMMEAEGATKGAPAEGAPAEDAAAEAAPAS